MSNENPSWWRVQEPKMIFGLLLMLFMVVLAALVALAHVHQDSSYGLDYILGSLATLAGQFGQWAFGRKPDEKDKQE